MSDLVLNKNSYKPNEYVEITLENITNDDKLKIDTNPVIKINNNIISVIYATDYKVKFKAPDEPDGSYTSVIINSENTIFIFTIQIEAQAIVKEIDNYNSLHFNIFYLYPRSFLNCLTYVYLKNTQEFKNNYAVTYKAMSDRSPTKSKDVPTTTTSGALQKIIGGETSIKESIIKDYDNYLSKLSNLFIKDSILNKFDFVLTSICGFDNTTGLRKVDDILDYSEIEDNINNDIAKINYINLFADQSLKNLKELINENNKVVFEVNNISEQNPIYFFNNSFDYTTTLNLKTDYSDAQYNKNKPDEFTYLCNNKGTASERGFIVTTTKNRTKSSQHIEGTAIDTNINFTGNKIARSNYSFPIKKLLIMDYLYSNIENNLAPCRIEINDDNVPHIHIDSASGDKTPSASGVALFRGSYLYFMNCGDSDNDLDELDGKIINVISEMIIDLFNFSSYEYYDVVFTDSTTAKYYEYEKIITSTGIKFAKFLTVGEEINSKIVSSKNTTDINDDTKSNYYNIYKKRFNEFYKLNNISFDNGNKGYIRLKNSSDNNMLKSVEYRSLLITSAIIEYFNHQTYTVANSYIESKKKVFINGNFIVVEK